MTAYRLGIVGKELCRYVVVVVAVFLKACRTVASHVSGYLCRVVGTGVRNLARECLYLVVLEVWSHYSRQFQSVERCYVNLCLSSNTVVPICNVTTIYKFCHKVFTVFHVAPHTVLPAYGIYWRTLALGCTHRVDGRRERLRTRECHIEVGSDVFIDVEVVVDTQHISLIVLVDIQTVVLVVAERSLCLHVLCTSGYADGMSHARSRPF